MDRAPEHYMKMAIGLAMKAKGRTSPNPLVGAVVVNQEEVVGTGHHEKAGLPHAEIIALSNAKKKAQGGDLYVNLEPCSHFGRTPPCCDALIEAGIKRVFIGMKDPNPLVSGKGLEKLNNAGIETIVGILEDESQTFNEIFVKYITTKKPFVVLKSAASLDGKIAVPSGDSKWITGEQARAKVHELRDEVDAILVGANTVIKDDPQLTSRVKGRDTKNPVRVILDSSLKIPEHSRVLQKDESVKTIIAVTGRASSEKIKRFEDQDIQIIQTEDKDGKVDWKTLLVELGKMEVTSLLIEGGSEVNASALQAGIVDKIIFFFAPKIIGGSHSIPMFGLEGAQKLSAAVRLVNLEMSMLGDDIMVTGYVHGNH